MEFSLKTLVVAVAIVIFVAIILIIISGWATGSSNAFQDFLNWLNRMIPSPGENPPNLDVILPKD